MRRLLFAVLILPLASTGPALAQLSIDEARLDDEGYLVVRGKVTKDAQRVTLDRKFTTRSKAGGAYYFRVRRLSFVCRVEVRSGDVQEAAKVDNCMMDDQRRVLGPQR